MIARAAESNPSCFSSEPLRDVERTLIPPYLSLAKYLNNHWSLTKFCVSQFKGQHVSVKKADATRLRQVISQSKDFSALGEIMGAWTGKEEFEKIVQAIEARSPRDHRMLPGCILGPASPEGAEQSDVEEHVTPRPTQNPEPPGSGAPLFPSNMLRMMIPPMVSGLDAPTPSPTPPISGGVLSMTVV